MINSLLNASAIPSLKTCTDRNDDNDSGTVISTIIPSGLSYVKPLRAGAEKDHFPEDYLMKITPYRLRNDRFCGNAFYAMKKAT